ncbi:ubiquitin C-terminal hydrolase 37 [Talaromyces stipitatus ATCC 10500]|uniref:Ubiquitin carboxyl-terminal hydrolase n=1 Tax=Talaromyces stipitatus (strain ATCC 10500 / CBS 375.48 / QM 6759 / NRRL 1006) TaxID=441959 RepID=B8MNR7_TALSN|nr:ubiquitin C-terminal hydrolase 37 [Talaromyces stipitatus ATCC 10500]EED14156.1 ubiquitin C-terminal hydrolase 37 [Talaromyces stipitatus ATCC 10500]
MRYRTKRRRLNSDASPIPETIIDKSSWNGFCEIESEPAFFNVMLREFGVEGVKVQEVVSLDKEMIELLPKPVYGVIFLFRWHEDNPEKQEASCPDGLWFANQTADNACASVALLNIVNNIDNISLGDTLASFKEFTMPFTPALRGDAIANFEFIKRIHNSFARSMDILNSDLSLKNEATASRSNRQNDNSASNEAAYHFIAFVPALGRAWKFDGLERQPQDLASCTDGDWLEQVRSHLVTRMTEYEEDQIEFSVLSLVRDPLRDLTEQLARNVKSLQSIKHRLNESQIDDIKAVLGTHDFDGVLLEANLALGLTEQCLIDLKVPETENCSGDHDLPQEYVRLANNQQGLRRSILEEIQLRRDEDAFAEGKRHDYSSAMEYWARALAHKGVVKELLS